MDIISINFSRSVMLVPIIKRFQYLHRKFGFCHSDLLHKWFWMHDS